MIKLIINADDFGYSKVFNEKILELLDKSYIRSTTVMVNRLNKEQEKQIERLEELYKNKVIGAGLHLEIDDGKVLLPQILEQYKRFEQVFGRKPSHLDIHKEHPKSIEAEIAKFAEHQSLPIRNHEGMKTTAKTTKYPAFSCPNWVLNFDIVKTWIEGMEDEQSYELITHPGDYDPQCKSSLNKERRSDYEILIKLQDILKQHNKIKIVSYLDL